MAIGTSNNASCFFISTGARFIVINLSGSLSPQFFSAALTRSLLSFIALSGSPTIKKFTSPNDKSASTSIKWASIPTVVAAKTLA
jgi:hypothetical protein